MEHWEKAVDHRLMNSVLFSLCIYALFDLHEESAWQLVQCCDGEFWSPPACKGQSVEGLEAGLMLKQPFLQPFWGDVVAIWRLDA